MSAMTNFTMRSLRANRVRTFVTIAGVALAAALIAAILTSYTSLTDFLYRAEAATQGAWMSYAESDNSDEFETGLQDAKDSSSITALATFSDKGYAQLTNEQQSKVGQYLSIVAAEGDLGSLTAIKPSEGRLPENDHEILLYSVWKTSQDVQLGDSLTLQVGEREALAAGDSFDHTTEITTSFGVGSRLNFSTGYLEPETDGGTFAEHLVDLHEETYTVVGFYDRANYALVSAVGTVGLTCGQPSANDFTRVFLTFDDVNSSDEVFAQTESLFPDSAIVLHSAMLRYMGIASDAGIWKTFNYLIIILAAIIALACVSLIFNAFNISVAERMNAFGLLSSIGATPAQLRRSVLLEGLIIAVVGIPLGLIVGLLGCAITFALLGPGIAHLAGGGVVPFELKIDMGVLIVTTVLTLLAVLVSAWIPSKRASRVNIIDALRQKSSSRISKKGARRARKVTALGTLWRRSSLAGKVFGIGGTLARINRRRAASKGRAAGFSLAIAIVLLMTAGSLNSFLGTLVDAATGGSSPVGEVGIMINFESDDLPASSTTPQQLLEQKNTAFSSQIKAFEDFYDDLTTTPNAAGVGWLLNTRSVAVLPSEMCGEAFDQADSMRHAPLEDGRYATDVTITYLADEVFDDYARSIGQEPTNYHDPDHPRAIALAQAYGNDGDKYQLLEVLRSTGTINMVSAATVDGTPVVDLGFEESIGEDGESHLSFVPYVSGEQDNLEAIEDGSRALDIAYAPLEVAALTDEAPMNTSTGHESVSLIVPASLAEHNCLGGRDPWFYSYFNSSDGDHAALAETLEERTRNYFLQDTPYKIMGISFNDFIEEQDSNQMLATIVNVFCLLFTLILALIAMANVFNTVTNSLILRRREFAVMRSIGLSPKQFRRMIIDECLHFGIVGLIPGLVASFIISLLLYVAVAQSLNGLPFVIPWGYLGLAILMTAAIMIVSVLYGLHHSKTDNVVEALRADTI